MTSKGHCLFAHEGPRGRLAKDATTCVVMRADEQGRSTSTELISTAGTFFRVIQRRAGSKAALIGPFFCGSARPNGPDYSQQDKSQRSRFPHPLPGAAAHSPEVK